MALIDKVLEESNFGSPENNIVRGLPWTDLAQVFREYKPKKDSIEYTIFWREPQDDGSSHKMRMDFEVRGVEFEKITEENWIARKAHDLYKNGDYVDATAYAYSKPIVLEPDAPVEETEEEPDPFAPENAAGLALITQMRILDMLYAIYTESNPEKAKMIIERHAQGKIIGPLPNFDPEQA